MALAFRNLQSDWRLREKDITSGEKEPTKVER
jgi:hypothetical protein